LTGRFSDLRIETPADNFNTEPQEDGKPMCGRFNLRTNPNLYAEYLAIVSGFNDDWKPNYNVAPTQNVACVRDADERELFFPKWGLIPSWAKDAKIGSTCINARSETIDTKPAFRSAFKKHRCIVLADGFYEWRQSDKVPHFISLKSGKPMLFAGLWETWDSKSDKGIIESCTICTIDANDWMGELHDRMPVILPRASIDLWLDPKLTDVEILKTMLLQYPGEDMQSWEVSKAVGSVKNRGAELMEPISDPKTLKFE
jgi:putative SOS response-associated peptidase YedK